MSAEIFFSPVFLAETYALAPRHFATVRAAAPTPRARYHHPSPALNQSPITGQLPTDLGAPR